MGGFADFQVKRAAIYLMDILASEKSIRYGVKIYDGSREKASMLERTLDVGEGEAEHLIDVAIYELEGMELIEKVELKDLLSDGENDFVVLLTAKGERFRHRVNELEFWGAE